MYKNISQNKNKISRLSVYPTLNYLIKKVIITLLSLQINHSQLGRIKLKIAIILIPLLLFTRIKIKLTLVGAFF